MKGTIPTLAKWSTDTFVFNFSNFFNFFNSPKKNINT